MEVHAADGINDCSSDSDLINLLTKADDLCFDKSKPPKTHYVKHKNGSTGIADLQSVC